jgi:hypothetical protein
VVSSPHFLYGLGVSIRSRRAREPLSLSYSFGKGLRRILNRRDKPPAPTHRSDIFRYFVLVGVLFGCGCEGGWLGVLGVTGCIFPPVTPFPTCCIFILIAPS